MFSILIKILRTNLKSLIIMKMVMPWPVEVMVVCNVPGPLSIGDNTGSLC